jgi:hypothetical protein
MRRRRHGLRPETFPFLAVLLCAMGSLILLLLVMDKRAKAVARAKALRAVAQAAALDEEQAAAQKAEWERRRQALHEALERQEQEARAQMEALLGKLDAVATQARAEETRAQDLRRRLDVERGTLAQGEAEVAARRDEAAQAARQSEAARAELVRLTAELHALERTLAELKAARQREQRTYSLVPYRGKRGDDRRPLYVECVSAGLIFQPDRRELTGPGVTAADVRAEVERRVARQKEIVPAAKEDAERHPYLLFLVRPDGIASYYQALAALDGLPLDFGYEFIDADWLLDLSDDGKAPGGGAEPLTAKADTSRSPEASPTGTGASSAGWGGPTPDRFAGGGAGAVEFDVRGGSTGRAPSALPPSPLAGEGRGGGDVPAATGTPHPDRPPQDGLARSASEGQPNPSLALRANPSAPPPAPRKTANRDWVLSVECTADALVLYPGGQRVPTATLARGKDGAQVLSQAVQDMIARRQAMVRPGEAPYRPQIRFLVRPDGLRSFYAGYPALEALRIPMTRQNLDQDEEIK